MSAPEQWIGNDGERQILVTRYDDGTVELATRPLADEYTQPSYIWSPPVTLEVAP